MNTKELSKKYFEGVIWVFENYFNRNNHEENVKKISTWVYNYNISPLLSDVVSYMNDDKPIIGDIINNFKYVPIEKYLTISEHYSLIYPISNKSFTDENNINYIENKKAKSIIR